MIPRPQVHSERAMLRTHSWAWVLAVPVVTLYTIWMGVGTPYKSMELGGQEKKYTVSHGGEELEEPSV